MLINKNHATNKKITAPQRRNIVMIFEDGPFLHEATCWRNRQAQMIPHRSIQSLFARYLVMIVVESRYRRRHTVLLTEVGERVARDLIRERDEGPSKISKRSSRNYISEKSALFIAEITS